jgi:TPR repeat protein
MRRSLIASFLFTCCVLPVIWVVHSTGWVTHEKGLTYTHSGYVFAAEGDQGDEEYEAGNKARQDLDNSSAAAHYRKAALLGHKKAQFRLALLCTIDHEVCKDKAEAVQWMRASAEQDYTPAQRVLGHWYLLGYGVEKNADKAKQWLISAANKEDDIAMYLLGRMYATGEGVEKNYDKALKWFRLAKANGYPLPAEYLRMDNLPKLKPYKTQQSHKKIIKSREDIIKEVQSGLAALGYKPGPADGKMGKKTQRAIKAFQQKVGIPVDGKISQELVRQITEELKK